jgi:hypothetical protein
MTESYDRYKQIEINSFLDSLWEKYKLFFLKNNKYPKFIYLGHEETYLVRSSQTFMQQNTTLMDKKYLWGCELLEVDKKFHCNITG